MLREEPKQPAFAVPSDHASASTSSLHPCTELARINSCDLDSKLRFQAEDHVYFYDGKRVGCSVACLHLQKCEHTIDMAGTMNTSEKGFR